MQTAPQTEKTADLRGVHTSNLVACARLDVCTSVTILADENSKQEVDR